ncbi:hypothetical protein MK079_02065 [Candidatus Gracilibacteria bacterium]|nr:hypothetical protein [Candidatus Gracilibacteria bacterium]
MFHILLIILCITTSLIFGNIDDIFGWDIIPNISGNYEFTKTVFFIVFTQILFIFFIIRHKGVLIPKYLILLTGLIIFSTLFSISPLTSIIGGVSKGHGAIMFFSLILLSIIVYNLSREDQKNILKHILYTSPLICLFALWQYISPSFEYGDLQNRAFGSFGHPNYLAGYILLLLPLLSTIEKNIYKYIIGGLLIITLILTKSAWALLIAGCYFIGKSSYPPLLKGGLNKYSLPLIGGGLGWGLMVIILSLITVGTLYEFGLGIKLHSFLARFFIWEATLSIIFSDIKILLFGAGFETLPLLFDSYKSEYLYIFENIGFRADRPHNILLNIFYTSGILGLITLLGTIIYLLKYIQKSNIYVHSLVLMSIFLIFNYTSVVHWMIVIVLVGILLSGKNIKKYTLKNNIFLKTGIIGITSTIIFLIGSLYTGEIYAKKGEYLRASQHFPLPNYFYRLGEYELGKKWEGYASEEYFVSQVVHDNDILSSCHNLITHYTTVENYFYCGEIFEKRGYTNEAKKYYQAGLDILPNLWNPNSVYYNNFIIKYFVDGKRFMSEKYSSLAEILKKINP